MKSYMDEKVSLQMKHSEQKQITQEVDQQIEDLHEQMEQTLIELANLNNETNDIKTATKINEIVEAAAALSNSSFAL